MENLKPAYYFSQEALEKYKELFVGEYVWEALSRIKGFVDKAVEGLEKKVIIGEGTVVDKGATIIGPAVIGKNCQIRAGSYIREYVIIGDNCVVRSEMKNCVMMDNSHAAHLSYIGDSIIGERVNLGALTVLSNVSLSEKPVVVKVQGQKIDTGLTKFGAILGDDVHTGSGALTNPGTLVGKKTNIYPNLVAQGFYPSNSIIKLRQEVEKVEKK